MRKVSYHTELVAPPAPPLLRGLPEKATHTYFKLIDQNCTPLLHADSPRAPWLKKFTTIVCSATDCNFRNVTHSQYYLYEPLCKNRTAGTSTARSHSARPRHPSGAAPHSRCPRTPRLQRPPRPPGHARRAGFGPQLLADHYIIRHYI